MVTKPKLGRRSKRLLIIGSAAVLIILVIATLVHIMQAPAVGTVSQKPTTKQEITDPYKEPGLYKGKYISFTYPEHYKQNPSATGGNYLETVAYTSTDHTNKFISIGVTRERLADDSGVAYRRRNAAIYKEQPRTINSVSFTSSASGSERTTYVQLGDYVINVSLTSPDGADLNEDSQIVVGSLKLQ